MWTVDAFDGPLSLRAAVIRLGAGMALSVTARTVRAPAGANIRSTGVQLCRMVVEVGESSLRQEFWYRSHWIAPEADLAGADLACVDLNATSLFGSNLSGALLRSVNLVASDLSGADLSKANLSGLNGVAGWFARCNQF